MITKNPAARCLKRLALVALVSVPLLAVLASLRPNESRVKAAIADHRPAVEISSALRRVAAEDRQSIWASPEMAAFFGGLALEERHSFLASVALPWEKQFRQATGTWDAHWRRRVVTRAAEACEFFGTLDAEAVAWFLSSATLQKAGAEGYGFLLEESDPAMRLRFQALLEQMQLFSQSAR